MKKWASAMIAATVFSTGAMANTQDYKLVTVAGYLNFYLLNLNACEDFHPAVRSAAYEAEKNLYPLLDKLSGKMSKSEADQKMVSDIVMKRRSMLNAQIADGDFTIEHCQAIVKILNEDGLDKTLLTALD